MSALDEQVVPTPDGIERSGVRDAASSGLLARLADREMTSIIATFATTLTIFAIYLGQGIIIARLLGPLGRGEFGTAIYFPRDILLYAGLLGGVDIVNSYASRGIVDSVRLKYAAARLGIFSGLLTGCVAAIISVFALWMVGKSYLIPFALVCCFFVPWEHMQLTVSAVDRGDKAYAKYNVNRLVYALSFPVGVIVLFGLGIPAALGISTLWAVCIIFVVARMIGILPTFRGMNLIQVLRGRSQELRAEETEQRLDDNHFATEISSPTKSDNPYAATSVAEGALLEPDSVPTLGALLREGKPYALSMLATEIFERLDIFLIVAMATVVQSGHYFVAVPAATLLTVAPNALGVFTFNAGADNRKISVKNCLTVMGATAGLQVIATVFFAMIIPYMIVAFYGTAFQPAVEFAMWLLPACAIKGFLQAADGYLKGRGKPIIGVYARVLSIAVMLVAVWLLYPRFELISIPMAACMGQALSMVIISIAVVKEVQLSAEKEEPSLLHEGVQ